MLSHRSLSPRPSAPEPGLTLFGVSAPRRPLRRLATVFALALTSGCSVEPGFERYSTLEEQRAELSRAIESEEASVREENERSRRHLEMIWSSPDESIRLEALEELRYTEHDWVVPGLLAQLHRERTEVGRVELALTLAEFHNYSGLDALLVLKAGGSGPNLQGHVDLVLAEIARKAEIADATELWQLWNHGDPDRRLPAAETSKRHQLEVWNWVERLASPATKPTEIATIEFVLSSQPDWAAPLLAAALHETNTALATGSARALGGMGKRGLAAAPELMSALDAGGELAVEAANALASIGDPRAVEPLLAHVSEESEPALRRACVRALGRLGLPQSFEVLEELLESSPSPELRLDAAEALVLAAGRDSGAQAALELLKSSPQLAGPCERTLELWLRQQAQTGHTPAREALAAWTEPAGPPGVEPTPEERKAQRARRITAVESLLAESAQQ